MSYFSLVSPRGKKTQTTNETPTPPQNIVGLQRGIRTIEDRSGVRRLGIESGHETDTRYEESKCQRWVHPTGCSHEKWERTDCIAQGCEMISFDTPCTALAVFKEGEFMVQQKGYKDAWGVENFGGKGKWEKLYLFGLVQ